MPKRYCCVQSCPLFRGTSDGNARFFCSPKDPDLRAKWDQAINRPPIGNFRLCSLHFKEEDIIWKSTGAALRSGAIPIPVPVPKTESLPETHVENVELIDIATIMNASSTRNLCQSCFDYDVKLQAAYAKIALLEKEMGELRSRENKRMQTKRIVKNQIRSNSTQDTEKKTCSLCLVKLTAFELERHLCTDDENIVCSLCPTTFKSTVSFIRHITKHSEMTLATKNRLMFKCNQCNLAYSIKTLLECHKKSHEDNPPPPEELNLKVEFQEPMSVDENSNDDTMLPTSMLTVELNESVESARQLIQPSTQSSAVDEPPKPVSQDNKLFKCGLCDVAFELPKQLSCHVRENHDSKDSFQCYLCKFDFATVKQLWMHMKRHARDQKCDICKTELTLNELNSHLCGDGKSIRCDYCVDDFTITSKLVDHLEKSHKKRKIHRCEICSKVFWSIALKELHMLSHAQDAAVSTHEQDTAMPFACDICSKVFCKKFQLGRHMKTHDEQRPYLCEECGKGFKSAQNLLLHKTSIHYNEPTLQCPDCPRKFFRLCLLKSHSAVHRKDRDDKYVCEICQAELVSKVSYKSHLKIHRRTEADRKFACKICPMKFFNVTHLKKHQRAHTGARLFKCRFCDQSYKYSGDLNKHLRTHLGNEIYECPKCPKRFKYPNELQKHEFEHYKEEKEANQTMELIQMYSE